MVRAIEESVIVAAPAAEVWERLADLEDHASWMADAESVEFLGESRQGPGTRIKVTTGVGPFRVDDIMEFGDWDPPRSMAVSHVGRVAGSGVFRLEDVPAGTRLVWTEDLSFPWYMGGPLGLTIAKPILRRIFASNLRRFAATFA